MLKANTADSQIAIIAACVVVVVVGGAIAIAIAQRQHVNGIIENGVSLGCFSN